MPESPFDPVSTTFDEIERISEFFTGWDGRFEQVSSGKFSGQLLAMRGEDIKIVSIQTNQRVHISGNQVPGFFSVYPVIPTNAAGIWQGRRLLPGQIVVHGPNSTTDHLSAKHCGSLGFSMSIDRLATTTYSLLGSGTLALPDAWAVLDTTPETSRKVVRSLNSMFSLAMQIQSGSETTETRQFEQDCIRTIVEMLTGCVSRMPRLPNLAVRARLTRQAVELMRNTLQSPMGIIDICAYLRVSARTLRLAFQEYFSVGPMTYYRFLRLNAVRTAIRTQSHITVSDLARGFGFSHLGNFAADYRRLFGELPSATRQSIRER